MKVAALVSLLFVCSDAYKSLLKAPVCPRHPSRSGLCPMLPLSMMSLPPHSQKRDVRRWSSSLRSFADQDFDGDSDSEDSSPPPTPSDSSFGDNIPKLNSVTLVGRVGQQPNPRYFDNGNVVVNVSLAVKRKYHPLERKVRDIRYGDEETDWFPLEIWGRDAEYCAKFVKKG